MSITGTKPENLYVTKVDRAIAERILIAEIHSAFFHLDDSDESERLQDLLLGSGNIPVALGLKGDVFYLVSSNENPERPLVTNGDLNDEGTLYGIFQTELAAHEFRQDWLNVELERLKSLIVNDRGHWSADTVYQVGERYWLQDYSVDVSVTVEEVNDKGWVVKGRALRLPDFGAEGDHSFEVWDTRTR